MSGRAIPHLRPAERPVERAAASDPLFLRASEVLADKAVDPVAVVIGAPYAGASLSKARCDAAPAAIRAALSRFSAYSSDFGVSLELASVLDGGDVDVGAGTEEVQQRVEACVRALSETYDAPVAVLGGDNSITAGAARGASADALVTFDAHHDVRDGISNGSPVRQLLEGGLAGERVVQIGIHGWSNGEPYAQRAADAGVAWVPASTVRRHGIEQVVDQTLARLAEMGAARTWVDFDLDVLDRAFAPGTAASMPGGLWPSDLEQAAFLLGASPLVAGIDITEVDPTTDVAQATVRTACAVLLSFVAGVVSR